MLVLSKLHVLVSFHLLRHSTVSQMKVWYRFLLQTIHISFSCYAIFNGCSYICLSRFVRIFDNMTYCDMKVAMPQIFSSE